MKVLLSAFSCQPNKGSELAIGWNWAIEIAHRGHDVYVLTEINNQDAIEQELQSNMGKEAYQKLHFYYYKLPLLITIFRNFFITQYVYFFLWQLGAYLFAKKLHETIQFDLAHHITFGNFRMPSLMGNLGIPFIWGPVGGGESASLRLRKSYSTKGKVVDFIRDVANLSTRLDPLFWNTCAKATQIYTTTEQTKSFIPKRYHNKVEVLLAIGQAVIIHQNIEKKSANNSLKLLFAGRILHWKGLHLALLAIKKLVGKGIEVKLFIAGNGPEKSKLQQIATNLGIQNNINWIGWVTSKQKMQKLYQESDIFLFPSLHDSGGMVVLEAMSHGLPVVCLDLGGPAISVNDNCGRIIKTYEKTEQEVAQLLANSLEELHENFLLLNQLSKKSIERSKNFSWANMIEPVYNKVENQFNHD